MTEFLLKLKRRNIFRVTGTYLVVAWLLIEASGTIAPLLNLPENTQAITLFLTMAGFPIALAFVWNFELTKKGIHRIKIEEKGLHKISTTKGFVKFSLGGTIIMLSALFAFKALQQNIYEGSLSERNPSSIAVLPFINMSSDPEQNYFSDGISEEILNVLAQIPDLHVTSRSSAFQYRGKDIDIPKVAAHLGVANILEGSVRKSGNRVRITAQLISSDEDKHLWSETYDRDLEDIFAIQDEIAGAIVSALREKLGIDIPPIIISSPSKSVEAYDFYLRGLEIVNESFEKELYEKAKVYLEQAITLDPTLAAAHAALCLAETGIYFTTSNPKHLTTAKKSCDQAKSFDSTRNEVKLAQSQLYRVHGKYDDALVLLKEVLKEDPESFNGYYQLALIHNKMGDSNSADKAYLHAISLRPNSWKIYDSYGGLLFKQNKIIKSREIQEKALWLSPNNPLILSNLGAIAFTLGDFEKAAEYFSEGLRYGNKSTIYSNLGAMNYFMRSFENAIEMYRAAVLLEPNYYWNWEGLHASLRFQKGRKEEEKDALIQAIFYARESIKVNPKSPLNRIMLGLLQSRSGDFISGRENVERGLTLNSLDNEVLFFSALEAVEAKENTRAIELLTKAYQAGYSTIVIKAEPALDSLRKLERFNAIFSDIK